MSEMAAGTIRVALCGAVLALPGLVIAAFGLYAMATGRRLGRERRDEEYHEMAFEAGPSHIRLQGAAAVVIGLVFVVLAVGLWLALILAAPGT
jgi:hypothetical protein